MKNLRNTMTWKTDHEDFIVFLNNWGRSYTEKDFTVRMNYAFEAIAMLPKIADFDVQETYEGFLGKILTAGMVKNKVLRSIYVWLNMHPYSRCVCKNLKDLRKLVLGLAFV